MAPSSTRVLPPTLTARARGLSRDARAIRAGHAAHERLKLTAERARRWLRDTWPGGRWRRRSTFSACDQILLRFFQRCTICAVARSVEPRPPPFLLQVAPRALQHRAFGRAVRVSLEIRGNAFEEMPPPAAQILDRPQGCDGSVPDRKRGIRNQQLGCEIVADSQAFARQAHPLRAVEAEELRTGRVEAQPAGRAGIVRRKQQVRLPVRPPR